MTQDLTKLDRATLEAMVASFQANNKPKALSLKVSEKGAVSVYGMGKWPITMYQSQWTRVLDHADQIKAFIVANQATLAVKV